MCPFVKVGEGNQEENPDNSTSSTNVSEVKLAAEFKATFNRLKEICVMFPKL